MRKTIGIELNDVLRDYTGQFLYVFKKFIDPTCELSKDDIKSPDYSEALPFKTRGEYETFRYTDYPYEIHARADECSKGLDTKMNLWLNRDLSNLLPEYVPEVIYYSALESNLTIQSTLAYLAAHICRVREILFPQDSTKIWDRCDIVITANPTVLKAKPEGKISVKISTPYNEKCEADYTFDEMESVIDDPNRTIIKLLTE